MARAVSSAVTAMAAASRMGRQSGSSVGAEVAADSVTFGSKPPNSTHISFRPWNALGASSRGFTRNVSSLSWRSATQPRTASG
jgi:hypothetical protein